MASGSLESIHILHVDDEPDFADMAGTFLKREDDRFAIETATSASEGLERLAGDEFDCIISDYSMPGQNGIDFLTTVREEHSDLPFILFTGKGSEEVASDAISAGVTDYLQKASGTDQYTVLANRVRNAVERYRAEKTRERQHEAIETAQEGISILDEDGHYIYVNEAFAELHSYDPEEMVGRHWELAYFEEDVPEVREVILPEVEQTGYWHGETTSQRADGTAVEVDHTLAMTDRGELVCTVRDISDQRERQRQLRQSAARLEALFEHSPDMINVHDMDGNIIDPNPRLCEQTGYDADTLTDMKVWDLDRATDPDEARVLWEQMEVGDRHRFEGTYRRRDGSTFPVEVHIRRLRFESEDRVMAISRDVTDRKNRERELERYERILNTIDDIAFVVDDDRTVTYVNEAIAEYVDAPPEALVGERVGDLAETYVTDAEDWRRFEAVLNRMFDGDGASDRPRRLELTLEFTDCESAFEYQFSPLTEDGSPVAVVVTMRDITGRKQREETLREERDQLAEFASVISHDIRNPPNVAEGRVELAQEECESDHLDDVESALERSQALIDDLLTLAREGNRVDDIEAVDLGPLSEQCWRNVATGEATVSVEVDRTIRADRSRLQQLLENTYRNAIEHGRDDVTVTVGTLPDGFYIEDDGPGIPTNERDDAFDAGYSTTEGGTGFGLSIAKQIADAHGWEIAVTESSTGGARFEITGVEFSAE